MERAEIARTQLILCPRRGPPKPKSVPSLHGRIVLGEGGSEHFAKPGTILGTKPLQLPNGVGRQENGPLCHRISVVPIETTRKHRSRLCDVLFGTTGPSGGRHEGMIDVVAKSAARAAGSQLGRQILRGVFGSLLRGR